MSFSENRLLARLPGPELERLAPKLKPVKLDFKLVLYRASEPIKFVYFPNRGTASAVTVMEDGSAIEVATIGKEGMIGLSVLFAGKESPNEVIMQIAGDGLRMDASALQQERVDGPLRQSLLQYNSAFQTQVSYSVACNGLHPVQQRCCRWLLMTHDRMDSDEVPLTHEYLAIMLGVRRASVTDVLGPLAAKRLIDNERGKITIIDRPGLEKLACECYRRVKNEYDRLLG